VGCNDVGDLSKLFVTFLWCGTLTHKFLNSIDNILYYLLFFSFKNAKNYFLMNILSLEYVLNECKCVTVYFFFNLKKVI